jgi:hypothetical protein
MASTTFSEELDGMIADNSLFDSKRLLNALKLTCAKPLTYLLRPGEVSRVEA